MNACISVLRNAVEKFSSLNPDVLKLVLCEDKCIDYIQGTLLFLSSFSNPELQSLARRLKHLCA